MKVAFDENVPMGMVRVFQSLAKERRLRRLSGGLTIESAKDYTPKVTDADYVRRSDIPWVRRFAAAGGKAIISGDVSMRRDPHEKLALVQCGFVAIFFDPKWDEWDFFKKSALLLNWWPAVVNKIKTARRGTFWCVPCDWREDGELRDVSLGQIQLFKVNPEVADKARTRTKRPKKRLPENVILTNDSKVTLFDWADGETLNDQTQGERRAIPSLHRNRPRTRLRRG